MNHSREHRLDSLEEVSDTVRRSRAVLKKHKKKIKPEKDCWRVRVGKTTYCFTSKRKMNRKLKELENYEIIEPGQPLPAKKLKL